MKYYCRKYNGIISEVFYIEDNEKIYIPDAIEITKEQYDIFCSPTPEELLINKKRKIRNERYIYLKAFDIYKTNVYYGIETETTEEHDEIISWYNQILNITNISIMDIDNEITFGNIPKKILRYLQ